MCTFHRFKTNFVLESMEMSESRQTMTNLTFLPFSIEPFLGGFSFVRFSSIIVAKAIVGLCIVESSHLTLHSHTWSGSAVTSVTLHQDLVVSSPLMWPKEFISESFLFPSLKKFCLPLTTITDT